MTADRFVTCARGHSHWGAAGAAGLLLLHRDRGSVRYLLQRRPDGVTEPGTYGLPGGALRDGETPEQAARRECGEELEVVPDYRLLRTRTDDHGGWTYYTIVGEVVERFATSVTMESAGTVWVTREEAGRLPLHPWLRETWDLVARTPRT